MKATVSVKGVVEDIFEGLTDLEIMQRHKIFWASDLYQVYNRLIMMGIIGQDEIKERLPQAWKVKIEKATSPSANPIAGFGGFEEKSESEDPMNARELPRNKLFGTVEVCDMSSKGCQTSEIKDISELGLMLAPIKVSKNEPREFMIKPAHLEDVGTISFTAECRWTDGIRAGFKITSISPSNMRELQKFIRVFSFESL